MKLLCVELDGVSLKGTVFLFSLLRVTKRLGPWSPRGHNRLLSLEKTCDMNPKINTFNTSYPYH